jgi:hypothetical protein
LSPSRNSLGINAGSHISTLDRLYAWESRLYDEVKVAAPFWVLINFICVPESEFEIPRSNLSCSAFRLAAPSAGSTMRDARN